MTDNILYLLKYSPENNLFNSCIEYLLASSGSAQDSLLLYQDAVYVLNFNYQHDLFYKLINYNKIKIYGLNNDLLSRGSTVHIKSNLITMINYQQFVNLTIANKKTITW